MLQRNEHSASSEIDGGDESEADGANKKAEWIESADHHGPEAGGNEAGDQHDVFDCLPAFIAIGFDALLAAFPFGLEAADQVLQGAHRADPSAEEATEEECRYEDNEAKDQASIDCMRSQRVGGGYKRIKDEEHAHRAAHVDVR